MQRRKAVLIGACWGTVLPSSLALITTFVPTLIFVDCADVTAFVVAAKAGVFGAAWGSFLGLLYSLAYPPLNREDNHAIHRIEA